MDFSLTTPLASQAGKTCQCQHDLTVFYVTSLKTQSGASTLTGFVSTLTGLASHLNQSFDVHYSPNDVCENQ